MDDELPPLPPPLPPAHSRSFSSSSSSEAGSPRPAFSQWGGSGSARQMRRSGSGSSFEGGGTVRRGSGAGLARSGSRTRGSRSSLNSSPSPTTARAPALSRTLSAASTDSSRSAASHSRGVTRSNTTGTPTRSNGHGSSLSLSSASLQRTRSSSILAKVSPSLATNSRFSTTHASLSSVGLRATPPVSPSATSSTDALRSFAKGLGQLPSPPHTVSDAGSASGSGRFGTVRSNGTDLTSATSSSGGSGGGDSSPSKPQRPPKSEARQGSLVTTPTKSKGTIPLIGRTSPTVVGSPAPAGRAGEASLLSSPRRRTPLQRDTFAAEAGEGEGDSSAEAGDVSGASTTPTRGDDSLVGEPKRRLRARTASDGAESVLAAAGEEERRRERRRRNDTLKEKNQRILDSINRSPSSSSDSIPTLANSPPPPRRPSTLRRSSTSSTLREIAEGRSPSRQADDDWLPGQTSTSSSHDTWLEDDRRPLRPVASVDEFGSIAGAGSMRRSQTLGNLAAEERERIRPSQAQGYRSTTSSRASHSLSLSRTDPLPERSMTSMSSYPSLSSLQGSLRRSELVGSDRTRSASAFGDTAERDRELAQGMRRHASRELLASPRERTMSEMSRFATVGGGGGTGDLPDSPSYATSAASLRNRPALPREFLSSLSPTVNHTPSRLSSARSDLDFGTPSPSHTRASSPGLSSTSAVARERYASPRTSSPLTTPDPERRRGYSRSEGLELDERGLPTESETERTPRSAKKSSNGSGGSGERAAFAGAGRRFASETQERRTQSISEVIGARPYSRLSRGERTNGLRSPDNRSNGTLSPPLSSSRLSSDLQARRERLDSLEVGSPEWIAELSTRRARSRQSGSSGDARSSVSQSERERDRTIRAINDLLASQGIVAMAVNPTSPTSTTSTTKSSPRKRQSFAGFETSQRPRRISFADGTHEDSPSAPGASLTRNSSMGSRSAAGSALSGRVSENVGGEQHHKLLLSAFDRFDQHFSSTLGSGSGDSALPESTDLVKRMEALILSTTKLNTGLRALTDAIKHEQVQAQLDEDQQASTLSIGQFEKTVNALLRSSDDQVRTLAEDLIAFTRVERERDRLRRDGESGSASRPVSRASGYATGAALHSPPKHAATSSPYEGASVSLASARSPTLAREVLRNPLAEPEDSSVRRHTLNYAGRREPAHVRSPLASETTYETPSRRQSSVSTGAPIGLGLPLPARPTSASTPRRGKTSDGATVRAGSPPPPTSTIRFPTTTPSREALTQVDQTIAIPGSSPTRLATTTTREYRTYSEADRRALEAALEQGANLDEARSASPLTARESLRSASPEAELSPSPSSVRRPRHRLSTGAISSALKNALRPRRDTNETLPAMPQPQQQEAYSRASSTPRGSFESSVRESSPEGAREERRRNVEDILRRARRA
ncbi:hypothetical protein JCM10213_001107 [Rhodosporidiobolus nylandii]